MRVEVGRTTDRLAGVVDDDVEARPGGHNLAAESFDTRRVAQIQTVDFEPAAPFAKVRLLRIASRGIAREARRDDQAGTRAQKLEPGLVADLDAATGQERDSAAQVRKLGSLREVELAAGQAQTVVEMMNGRVLLLADVAVLRSGRLSSSSFLSLFRLTVIGRGDVARRESLRGKSVRRGKYLRTTADPDARRRAQVFVAVGLFLAAPAAERLGHRAAGANIRIANERCRRAQAPVLVLGKNGQRAPVGGNQFERLGRGPEAVEELCVGGACSISRHAPQE